MSILPEMEIVDYASESLRYLEHGWPSELCRWHAHEEYELHLIVESYGKAFVGDYIGTFEPGSLYLTGPNLPHNWVTKVDDSEPLEVRDVLVQFNHKNYEVAATALHEFNDVMPLLELARSGIEFVDYPFPVAREYMRRIAETKGIERMLAFLTFLNDLNAHPHKTVLSLTKLEQKTGNKNHDRIGEVVDYVISRYNENLSVADTAAMAGMSETSFSRNFRNATGNRFIDFINRVRIGQACVLLLETDQQISSICYDIGFQNLANFNRHFYKLKNITPRAYRNTARERLKQSSIEEREQGS
jgi:AraC-like DNA-binding protein